MSLTLTIVGCSGSYPGPQSPASCYLVNVTDADGKVWNIVIDLGNGALGVLQRHVNLEDIDAVFISHLHGDHFLDLCGLEVFRTYVPGKVLPSLPLYAPSGALAQLHASTKADSETMVQQRQPLIEHSWDENPSFTLGPVHISVAQVDHPVESYAIRIEEIASGEVLVYSGDSDVCDALVEHARDANIFLCEAAFVEGRDDHIKGVHLSGKRAAEVALSAHVGQLILTHIPPWNDPEVTKAEASGVLGDTFTLAASGDVYVTKTVSDNPQQLVV